VKWLKQAQDKEEGDARLFYQDGASILAINLFHLQIACYQYFIGKFVENQLAIQPPLCWSAHYIGGLFWS
jgi:hypothetical protein